MNVGNADRSSETTVVDDILLTQPTQRVRDFLEPFRGKRIYSPPLVNASGKLVGNHGDTLMVLGAERLYAEYGIQRIDSGDTADLITVGGSGGMVEGMDAIPAVLKHCCQQWPNTPLVVLPSTYYYPSRPFADEIGEREAPVTLFCREPYSFRHLCTDHKFPPHCDIQLDHDMAFELADASFVDRLRFMPTRHILIVERTDVEHHRVAMNSKNLRWRKRIGRLIGMRGKKLLYPLVNLIRSRQRTTFRDQCETMLSESFPEQAQLPRLVRDVSNVNANDFDGFQDAIGAAAIVFTTRLHVGLLAAMMDRPTFIFGGPYHKIAGMYQFSLSHMKHVHFAEPH
jgi:exopolysaccharide biosynthesis predicted pyruvyltransferase EpsI